MWQATRVHLLLRHFLGRVERAHLCGLDTQGRSIIIRNEMGKKKGFHDNKSEEMTDREGNKELRK